MPVLRGSAPKFGGWIRGTCTLLVASALAPALLCVALVAPRAAFAQTPPGCALAIAIPDRWDDVTPIAGYAGGSKKTPDWQNDGVWDRESFTDLNRNGLYDPGEPFVDANANGQFDAEAYSPLLTGYVPDPVPGNFLAPNGDIGLAIALAPAKPHDAGLGRYVPFDCSPLPLAVGQMLRGAAGAGSTGAVDRAMRDLIALDPGASWDTGSNQVTGSAYPNGSPRVILLPVFDPRFSPASGAAGGGVQVTKIVAVFLDHMDGRGAATVRFTRVPGPGVSAATRGAAPNSSWSSPSQSDPESWGRLKAIYR
jgi:hypothetical protein